MNDWGFAIGYLAFGGAMCFACFSLWGMLGLLTVSTILLFLMLFTARRY